MIKNDRIALSDAKDHRRGLSSGPKMTADSSAEESSLPDIFFHQGKRSRHGVECVEFSSILHRKNLTHSPMRPHRVHFHVLMFWMHPGKHEVDFKTYDCRPGDLLYIDSGSEQAFLDSHNLGQEVLLSGDLVRRLENLLPPTAMFALKMLRQHHLDATAFEAVRLCLQQIKNLSSEDISDLTLDFLVAHLVTLCCPPPTHLGSAKEVLRFKAFVDLVEKDFCLSHSSKHYANKLGMSPGRLSLLIQKMTGVSAKTWIDQYLLLQAKRRLSTEQISLERLSAALGFQETTHFVRFFKRTSGMTPLAFRQLDPARQNESPSKSGSSG